MENQVNNKFSIVNTKETINIKAELERYLINWKWFLLSVFLCGFSALLYVKSKQNIYESKSIILIKEDGGASTDLKVFQDLSSLGVGSRSNVLDEIEMLKSRFLAKEYSKKLNLNTSVYVRKGLRKIELYGKTNPFKLKVLTDMEKFYLLDTLVFIRPLDNYEFEYRIGEDGESVKGKFGERLSIKNNEILIVPKNVNSKFPNEEYKIKIRSIESVTNSYRKMVGVNYIDFDSNIVEVSLKYPVKEKAKLIINTLVDLYNQMTIDDQNLVCKKTGDFIENRLRVVKAELDEVDKLEEVYKKDKSITNLSSQSQVFIEGKSLNEQEIFEKETQLRLVNFMIQSISLKSGDNYKLLPANINIEESVMLATNIAKYNELLLERNRTLRTSSNQNPIVQNLNIELETFINNINQSLVNSKKQLQIGLESLKSVEDEFNSKIQSLPKQVREYRGILRRQEIIAELYSYLLQKKEENEITMAVTVAKSKVIDRAYTDNTVIAPKKKTTLVIGLLLGVLIPSIFIYLKTLLDTKLNSKKDLENVLSVPFLGDIPLDKSGDKIVISKGSRTSAAEAFRLLRTNLDFMLTSVQTPCKTIFVTSTISGEGKTFVAVNLGASIALTGKKVLIIGMDLRAPKITQYLDLPNRNGVTNYLVDKNIELKDLIFKMDAFDNLHLLSSGVVPPNPAELLLNNRVSELFEELKGEYDYIVVDTAPVNLVTDTLMISHHADMVLYTTRANYLDKRFLEVPERLYQEKRLPNMAILLNGLDYTRGYGYGYGGYGYPKEHEHKNFFQKIFRK
ncbi:polysaccharide biosynthesis tyrosine autokinase [Wenyingzhuangia sp. IMCC45574]